MEDERSWSAATWGWIAGIAVVVLVLVFAFSGGDSSRVATDTANPPSTTGQRTSPTPPAPGRPRLPFETALDGVFAAGDVRLGSMKRVAAAVGEGSSVIRSVHQYLASLGGREAAVEPSQGEHAPIPAG